MSFFLKALVAVALGTVIGLWSARATITHGFLFGAVAIGPWTAFPQTGSPSIDPYARAALARTGFVPIAADEGIAFSARTDSDGRALDGRCEYSLEGDDPTARFWTLGLFDSRGVPIANTADRHVLTSQDAVRINNRIVVAIAATMRGGNWLPAPAADGFVLVYTLYEPNGGTAASASTDVMLPIIRREDCGQ